MSGSPLVIVYHRQPLEEVVIDGKIHYRTNKSPNGIVPTLKSFFNTLGDDAGAWVAWKTYDPETGVDFERRVTVEDPYGDYTVSRLPLTAEQVESFYHVTSKEALWPILHSFPDRYRYDNVDWETFREVNRAFAEAAAEEVADDGLVWIHDYNLWLVPLYLRRIKPDVKIAFFHHTPFPGPDVFNVLPWRKEIVTSLLDCDLVGFHLPRYARNFAEVARTLLGARMGPSIPVDPALATPGMALSEPDVPAHVVHEGREVRLGVAPVGCNSPLVGSILETEENKALQQQLLDELGGRRLIMTVGRTDYTKGMIESLCAYERLLERRPELRGTVKMLATSVRAAAQMTVYEETQRDIEALVGRINGRYSTLDWTPVVLFGAAIPFDKLIAYYAIADVCLTAPLRDGLNLVAKEFVASKAGRPGVLILSEFAGCAVELPQALLTNPYSNRSLDLALDTALATPADEAAAAMAAMAKEVATYDLAHWAEVVRAQFAAIAETPGETPVETAAA